MPQEALEARHSPLMVSSSMHDSNFGVQSLEEAMGESLYPDSTTWLHRDGTEYGSPRPTNPTAVKKRKVSYPPHPRTARPHHRDVSSELPSTTASSAASPMSLRSSDSPFRSHLRRASNSSISLDRPLTPLKLSPNSGSAMPITPRSESVQSFRLSDEDSSVAWETNSQAIQSSNGDEDDKLSELDLSQEREPQLVMPSISMPARRPFTARGRTMGRLKVMVAGKSAVGKTSLIKSIVQSCKDIVHVDQVPHTTPNQSLQTSRSTDYEPTKDFVETQASTRPYPLWWSDVESSRGLWRRKSFGEGILERNICFIDTPGSDSEVSRKRILQEIESLQLENVQMDKMSDKQLLNLFSGEGGTYVDAVLYLFEPGPYLIAEDEHKFIRELAARTNVIPLIGRAENRHAQELDAYRENIRDALSGIAADWYSMVDISVETTGFPILDATRTHANLEPFAISCAVVDDAETIDASLLMASDYLQPLVPSELTIFLDRFMSSSNIARMRHLSAKKFLHWRRTHLSTGTKLSEQNILRAPDSLSPISSPYIPTGTNSLSASQSKVLVPYSNSDYYRSASPSATSDFSTDRPPATGTSANALAQHNSQTTGSEPFRQMGPRPPAQPGQRAQALRQLVHPAACGMASRA
jgi:septin family protein